MERPVDPPARARGRLGPAPGRPDGPPTALDGREARVRRRRADDDGPEGEWVLEVRGEVVAGGGIMTHYNPPYGDASRRTLERGGMVMCGALRAGPVRAEHRR